MSSDDDSKDLKGYENYIVNITQPRSMKDVLQQVAIAATSAVAAGVTVYGVSKLYQKVQHDNHQQTMMEKDDYLKHHIECRKNGVDPVEISRSWQEDRLFTNKDKEIFLNSIKKLSS